MNKTKQASYRKYDDSQHGWLAVKRSELFSLGILSNISVCSYQKGQTVYLEEDCDMTKFVEAKGGIENVPYEVIHHDKPWGQPQRNSPIRSYERFRADYPLVKF